MNAQNYHWSQIVLSEWKGSYYRAEIVSINKESKRANLHFIDYGNTHVESLDKLLELPSAIADPKFPALASVFKLVTKILFLNIRCRCNGIFY